MKNRSFEGGNLTSRDSLMQNIFSLLIAPSFSQFHAPSIRWRCGNFCSKAGVSFSALFLDPVTVQLHSEIQNLRSDQQRDPDRFLSERDHMELSTFFLTAAMVRQSIIRTATVSRSNSAIDWIDPGPSDAGTGIVSAAFAEKPLERTHRDCNRRILAGVIASGVVAVSRIRGTDGPGAVLVNVSLQLPFPVVATTVPEQVSPVLAVKVTLPVGL
jgi:hypothetical protein